jgi:Sec-independent protein translocase protein TatA
MKCHGRFKMQALTFCDAKVMSMRTAVGQFKGQFKGAMDEMSHKVQNASTHPLQRQSHEHTHNSRSVQVPVHGGDGGNVTERRFKMQTLTGCDAKVVSTRTAVGQFKGQFKGAMEEMSQKVQNANTHRLRCQNPSTRTANSQFKGAMERYMRGFDSAQKSRGPATIHHQQ